MIVVEKVWTGNTTFVEYVDVSVVVTLDVTTGRVTVTEGKS